MMNIIDFHTDFHSIDRSIELTKFTLEYGDSFSTDIKKEFNQALEGLIELLNKDQVSTQPKGAAWHTAYRIVHFKNTQVKLEKIRQQIFEKSEVQDKFIEKVQLVVLPALKDRVKKLKTLIEAQGRLPFNEGSVRAQYFEDIQQQLQLKNINQIFQVEKEYFHLLGNHLDGNKLKQVDIASRNGSLEIYSLISWEQVLNLFIQAGDASEKQIGSTLLSIIKEAMPFALKINFALNLQQIKDRTNAEAQETAYFEDYLESHRRQRHPMLTLPQFFNKYQLHSFSPIPERVIINEMAWDMLDSVSSLKSGEVRMFPLGTISHSIVVQVTCTQDSSISTPKLYEYKIFNTGHGVEFYHELDEKEECSLPLIYKNLPPSAFSYSFFSNILRISLEESSIDAFYQLHDRVLVQEAGGTKTLLSGAWYPNQKHDICAYASIEAWIDSYLSEKQIKHFEIIKAKMSTDKQEKVVKILRGRDKGHNGLGKTITGKRKNRPAYLKVESKSKRLKESEILLDLGHQYLQQAIQNFSGQFSAL